MLSLSKAWSGLVTELAGTVESLRSERRKRAPMALVERGGDFELFRIGRRGPELVTRGRLADLGVAKLPREAVSQPVEVRLDAARLLSKTLQLPATSREYLHAIVGHQLDRMTPWASDRVVFDYALADEQPAAKDQVAIRLVATSRDAFENAMERLAGAGIRPALIGTSDDPVEQPSRINLLQGDRTGKREALRRKVGAGLLAILVIGVTAGGLASWRLYQVEGRAAALQNDMNAARQAIEAARSATATSESFDKLLAKKRAAIPMVVLVDELSRAIPVGTYLSELTADGDELRISGLSDDAPGLIGILDAAALLTEVRFAAPTIRGEGGTQDRFEIVARILPNEANTQ